MKLDLKKAIVTFVWAYIVVTILAYALSISVGIIFKLPSAQELGVGMFEDPAFVMTVPYHILINLLAWTGFSHFYFRKKINPYLLKEVLMLGVFWLLLAMVVDLTLFVLIKSPFSLTPRQFYVEYQPWISITYLTVIIGPLAYFSGSKLRRIRR